jgi:CRISPR-associated exonuclease Cas4
MNDKNEKIEINPEMLIGGVKINYYFHCPTQLWYFCKGIYCEHTSDLVEFAKYLEDNYYDSGKRNILVEKINIDIIKIRDKVIVIEIKPKSKWKETHKWQLLYYLWYLKNIKNIRNVEGVLVYPFEKK